MTAATSSESSLILSPVPDDEARLVDALETDVRELLRVLRGSAVEELRLERGGTRIAVRRSWETPASNAPAAGHSEPETVEGAAALEPAPPPGVAVHALMVGIFHHAREPEGAPLAMAGDYVEAGSPIGVIETLGMASDVESPAAGRLQNLLDDGVPVEYSQVVARVFPE